VPPAELIVRTLHSAAADVEEIDVELELDEVVDELEVVPTVDVVVTEDEDVVGGDVVVVLSREDVVSGGAMATGPPPTCESANPTICHVSTVVRTRATTQAAAIRQLIMC
jgi:hypothetical protein